MPLADNDATRMSRLQLADRLHQMETTHARNSQLGSPNDRHRPMEDRRRAEKIARYRAELERRELSDAIDAAREKANEAAAAELARNTAQAAADARTAADLEAFTAKLKAQAAADAREKETTMHAADFNAYASQPPSWQEHVEHEEQMTDASERRNRRQEAEAEADARLPRVEIQARQHPTPAPARPKRQARPTPIRPTPTPDAGSDLSELERTVEQLVRQHTSGAVIEAAWAAAHRIFRPEGGRR